jgi:hypothetical protein
MSGHLVAFNRLEDGCNIRTLQEPLGDQVSTQRRPESGRGLLILG